MHLGLIIKELINKQGISVTEFAGKVGFSRQHVYDILEKQHLGTDVLEKISETLGVPIAYFFINTSQEFELLERIKWPEKQNEISSLKLDIETLKKEIENLKGRLTDKDLTIESNAKLILNNEQMIDELKKLLNIYERMNKNLNADND